MKKVWTFATTVALAAALTVPTLAAEIRARIKSVEPAANTITVTEGHKDTTFTVTTTTRFVNVVGKDLAQGIKSPDLRAGRRVVITYDGTTASEVKLRPADAPKK